MRDKNPWNHGWRLIIGWVVVGLVLIAIFGTPLYLRVSGDLNVCKVYYPEIPRLECYFSSKTVRVPK